LKHKGWFWLIKRILNIARSNDCYAGLCRRSFFVFADAASLRACGMFVAALQITSPMRPFNLALLRQIQTVLSLHGVRTIDAQEEV